MRITCSLSGRGTAFDDPRIGAEIVEGGQDGLANGQPRFPAQGTDLAGIEEDEGTVADPAAFPTAVVPLRLDVEPFTDPAQRLIDRAVFVRAEVEDVERRRRLVEDEEDGIDAVLNVEVRLALLAVAKNSDASRIAQELGIEIDDVAMRVALAEN